MQEFAIRRRPSNATSGIHERISSLLARPAAVTEERSSSASPGFDFSRLPMQAPVGIQPKLTVGTSDDPLEQEANRAAETALRMPEPGPSQSPRIDQPRSAPAAIAREAAGSAGSRSGGVEAPPIVRQVLNSPGEPLDAASRAFFEPRLGFDFSQVRLHKDSAATQSAAAIGASAYTYGNNVVLGADHAAGGDRRLMAHELAHVVQQSGGTSHQVQRKDKRKVGSHGISYARMLADKKLDIGVGIGVEFISEFDNIVVLLLSEGFTAGTSGGNLTFSKTVHMKVPGQEKRGAQKFTINVELVNQNSAHPKDSMAGFFAHKDVALYSGHARYGTGPDFDAKDSQKENFVIGVNSKLHNQPKSKLTRGYDPHMNKLLKGRPNDLEQMSKKGEFDTNRYQVWMFNACSSSQYLDEIRGGLVTDKKGHAKSGKNLRVFGTTHSIYSDCVPILKGLISLQSMEKIIATMDAKETAEAKAHHEHVFKSYYFSN